MTADTGRIFRDEWGRAVAALTRVLGDIQLAEDAVQDAFTIAVERWPRSGAPANPGAWIITAARNRAIDRLRREQTFKRKAELLARLETLPADVMGAVLKGYQGRYGALKDAVTETEPTFDDGVLATVPVVDLLTEPVYVLADRWR